MRKVFIILLLSIFLIFSKTGYSLPFLGTRPMGLAGAYSARADDTFAMTVNPAGLSLYPRYHVSSFYTYSSINNSYSTGTFAVDSKSSELAMGIGFVNWRYRPLSSKESEFTDYNITDNLWILSLSENYQNLFLIGMNLSIHNMRSSIEANDDTFTLDIGVLVPLGNYFTLSAVSYNPYRHGRDSLKSYYNDPRARSLTLGGLFHYKNLIFLQVDWNRDLESKEGSKHRISAAFSAIGRNFFEISLGYSHDFYTSSNHIGAGFSFKGPKFSVSYSYLYSKWGLNIRKEEQHSISFTFFIL